MNLSRSQSTNSIGRTDDRNDGQCVSSGILIKSKGYSHSAGFTTKQYKIMGDSKI